jgi:hypothetical protein
VTFYDFTASVITPDTECLSGFGEVHARAAANGARHGTPVLIGPGGWPDPRVNLFFRTGPMAEARPGTWRRYAYALVVWLDYLHVVGRSWVEATASDVEAFKEWRLTSLDNAGRVQPTSFDTDRAALNSFYSWAGQRYGVANPVATAGLGLARLVVEAMLVEHQRIVGLVDWLGTTSEPAAAAALARALRELFEAHLAKENDEILPLLVASPDVSVAELLGGMHELLGGEDRSTDGPDEASGGCGSEGHACGCGETDGPAYPELDARAIPHAIRHATIFGALDGVRPGKGLVLIAPHEPLPLLAQLEQRAPRSSRSTTSSANPRPGGSRWCAGWPEATPGW